VRGQGCRIGCDENEYLDYISSWAPHSGHAAPVVIEALGAPCATAQFRASTPAEPTWRTGNLGVPSIEKVRFVSSGTEATMSAIRLARAYTKRNYIVKFEGCYHGHADSLW